MEAGNPPDPYSGAAILADRQAAGLSQSEFAEALADRDGAPAPVTISKWERGIYKPGIRWRNALRRWRARGVVAKPDDDFSPERILADRQAAGLSREAMAKALADRNGAPSSVTVSKWERGIYQPGKRWKRALERWRKQQGIEH